jgi:hypothetical protein
MVLSADKVVNRDPCTFDDLTNLTHHLDM